MKKDRVNSAPARLALTPAWAVSAAGGSGIATRRGLPRWLAAASGGADPEPDDTIEVQRRRPTGESSAPRERAEAPVRRKTDGGGGAAAAADVIGRRLSAPILGPTAFRRPAHEAQPEDPAHRRRAAVVRLRDRAEVLWRRGYPASPGAAGCPGAARTDAPGWTRRRGPARADGRAAESIAHGQAPQAHRRTAAGCNGRAGRGRCANSESAAPCSIRPDVDGDALPGRRRQDPGAGHLRRSERGRARGVHRPREHRGPDGSLQGRVQGRRELDRGRPLLRDAGRRPQPGAVAGCRRPGRDRHVRSAHPG